MFGTAIGFINMMPIMGGGIAQVCFGFIIASLWRQEMHNGVPIYHLHDYQLALLIILISLLIGLFITHFFLPETRCQKVS